MMEISFTTGKGLRRNMDQCKCACRHLLRLLLPFIQYVHLLKKVYGEHMNLDGPHHDTPLDETTLPENEDDFNCPKCLTTPEHVYLTDLLTFISKDIDDLSLSDLVLEKLICGEIDLMHLQQMANALSCCNCCERHQTD